jgi:hypothetical protein
MIERIREFLRSSGGRIAGIAFVVVALLVTVYMVRSNLGESEVAALSRQRVYVCAETGKSFDVEITPGLTNPVMSPFSGKKTGYPAEPCFWTKSGEVRKEPHYVLLNQTVGKPGPTFCPDCGRLVIPYNPPPTPGGKPPPTQAEYKPNREG